MSLWASLCPPVCPSTVSLHLDLPLRVLKRVIVWHHPKGGVTLSLFWRLTFRGRGQVPAEIEWRPVTLVKRFAGSAETLTAILLTSRRDDWKRGAQPPRMRSEQRLMKSVWRAECWKELQGRMSMWASLCPPVCPSTVSLPLDLPLRVLKRVTVWHHPKV